MKRNRIPMLSAVLLWPWLPDGVRQDFVLLEKPEGNSLVSPVAVHPLHLDSGRINEAGFTSAAAVDGDGELRVELELTGARVEPAHFGGRLQDRLQPVALDRCYRRRPEISATWYPVYAFVRPTVRCASMKIFLAQFVCALAYCGVGGILSSLRCNRESL